MKKIEICKLTTQVFYIKTRDNDKTKGEISHSFDSVQIIENWRQFNNYQTDLRVDYYNAKAEREKAERETPDYKTLLEFWRKHH